MHETTFDYLKPSSEQLVRMGEARKILSGCAVALDKLVPDGPDKTYLMRKLREVGMWTSVAITRLPDGTPRA